MKIKNFSKKLILNKKTIADLVIHEMKAVYGGCTKETCLIPTLTGTPESAPCCQLC